MPTSVFVSQPHAPNKGLIDVLIGNAFSSSLYCKDKHPLFVFDAGDCSMKICWHLWLTW